MSDFLKIGVAPTGVGGPGEGLRWLDPEIPVDASVSVDWYIDIARQAEAAKLDFIFIVDSQFITPYSPPHYLNRLEPLTLLSALAVTTKHIGLVGTLTTSYNSPFNLARRLASLDLISHGRAGWNVVTSGDSGTAGNYGRDEHYDYDTRYALAHETIEVVRGLWKSYEEDAIVADRKTGVFLDPTKLHTLNHHGRFHKVTGPLNIQRSPQGEPIIFQAGDSEQGRDLGAATADAIFTHAHSIEAGQIFYRDIKDRAISYGRDPDQVLITPGARIYVADTDDQAREIEREYHDSDHSFDLALKEFGRAFGWHDFTGYDVDAPFPAHTLLLAEKSWYTQAKRITDHAVSEGLTLRQAVELTRQYRPGPFVGAAETVARELVRWHNERALDGINYYLSHPEQFRRFTAEVLPILRDLGVFRKEYEGTTIRDNLGLPAADYRNSVDAREPNLILRSA
ncbi:NtaA/DmoA family FMN-dependent monooxygenase [Acetobacter senegalensis]|uniref:NtaA/DmoA family FMN-dependent monooxygenase n=1 Tax=Acetobacter senegalensis TaxID=446692 RepID=UPI00209E5381|nr:NtaA/DmoA family FMN-dependent monooxygenase [Acetobacter senegalensis]MCP1196442.1 NtaA/DmoA family FMN-dependent monooxygenase [Acetobacter senegalensis]